MRYILNPDIALRSWRMVPYAYYVRGNTFAKGLKKDEFEIMLSCDGKTEIEESAVLQELLMKSLIKPCEGEESLSEWQRYRHCDNRYFPRINWMITGKCNYNCRHCFNAVDNAPLMSEWTLEEAVRLLEEAKACGVNAFTITGGEPMLHSHFFELLEEIYKRGMFVDELNTNGYFINRQILDRMLQLNIRPTIKISFDGIRHHDWLRNRKGAEQDALRAIKLCLERGFKVMVQTNVHRGNLDTLLETAKLLDSLGVKTMRMIRTTEAPRWAQNGGDATLEITEYYDRMLDFAVQYMQTGCSMRIIIWQFMHLFPMTGSYSIVPVLYNKNQYRDTAPVCKGARGMVAIAANGNVFPCHQLSGYSEKYEDVFDNVKSISLQALLQDSKYLCEVCMTVDKIREHDSKCGSCSYFRYCAGGCRAIAWGLTGDKLAADPSKCMFFEGGYYERIVEAMGSLHNLSEI